MPGQWVKRECRHPDHQIGPDPADCSAAVAGTTAKVAGGPAAACCVALHYL